MSDKNFIQELNDYCSDHFKHYKCYPLEFEYKDRVYKWNEFKKYIKGIKWVVHIMKCY